MKWDMTNWMQRSPKWRIVADCLDGTGYALEFAEPSGMGVVVSVASPWVFTKQFRSARERLVAAILSTSTTWALQSGEPLTVSECTRGWKKVREDLLVGKHVRDLDGLEGLDLGDWMLWPVADSQAAAVPLATTAGTTILDLAVARRADCLLASEKDDDPWYLALMGPRDFGDGASPTDQ